MAIPNAEKQPVRILVVDDESDLELLIRQHYRKEIKENTYLFTFARNGQEALEIIHEHPQEIDLILTDINMPEIDGLTLLSQLEHEDLILKPIIVSAYGDMANIRKAMNLGAFDFITKPINFEDMDITLKKTISIVRKLQTITELEAKHAKIQKEADEVVYLDAPEDFLGAVGSYYDRFPQVTDDEVIELLKLDNP